uniref:Uncharacterized protein n=1 Tax=Solanum lycopersicum TaxID=4081 RepID=K4B5Z7_SOLLC
MELDVMHGLSVLRRWASTKTCYHFKGIYAIFNYFQAVTKRSIVFLYLRHDILTSLVHVKFFLRLFVFIDDVFFLIFLSFWGINVIFDHFQAVQKEVMFCYLILHDIQRSLVQVEIF